MIDLHGGMNLTFKDIGGIVLDGMGCMSMENPVPVRDFLHSSEE